MHGCTRCTPKSKCNRCKPKCDPCSKQQRLMYCGRNLPCVGVLKGQDLNRVIELIGDEVCNLKQLVSTQSVRLLPNPDCDNLTGFIIEIYDLTTDEVIESASVCEPTLEIYYEVTVEEAQDLSNNSAFEVGATYGIINADSPLYGGTKVIVRAISNNQLEIKGTGMFFNPIYDEVSVSKGMWSNDMHGEVDTSTAINKFIPANQLITTDNGAQGIFLTNKLIQYVGGDWGSATSFTYNGEVYPITSFSNPQYSMGDRVVWGGTIWENTGGNIGSPLNDYELNTTDWTQINYNNVDYNLVNDWVMYDLPSDRILLREDIWGNRVETSFLSEDTYAKNAIKCFQWGRGYNDARGVSHNKIVEGSVFNCINSRGSRISSIEVTNNSIVDITKDYGMTFVNSKVTDISEVQDVFFTNTALVNIRISEGFIKENYIESSTIISTEFKGSNLHENIFIESIIQDTYISGIMDGNKLQGLTLIGCRIEQSVLSLNVGVGLLMKQNLICMDSQIRSNMFPMGASIRANTLNASNINGNTFNNGGYITNNNLDKLSEISNNTFEGDTTGVSENKVYNGAISFNTFGTGVNRIYSNDVSGTNIVGNDISLGSDIKYNNLNVNQKSSSAGITNCTVTTGIIEHNNIFGTSSSIQNCNLTSNSRISNNILSDSNITSITISNISSITECNLYFSKITGLSFSSRNILLTTIFGSTLDQSVTDFSSAVILFNGTISKKVERVSVTPDISKICYIDNSTNQFVIDDVNA